MRCCMVMVFGVGALGGWGMGGLAVGIGDDAWVGDGALGGCFPLMMGMGD